MDKFEEIAPSQERDRKSALLSRLISLAASVKGFQGRTGEEIFDPENEEGRRDLIERLSDEEYCELITGINGILRGKEKDQWSMDGVGVTALGHEVVGAHIFPRDADKKDIVVKSWEAAKQMNSERRGLEDIGMLLGSLLVETHPFADGNGRTSRLVYFMIKNGFSKERVGVILGEYGRDELDMALSKIYIDRLFETRHGRLNPELNKNGVAEIFATDDPETFTRFGTLNFPEEIRPETKSDIIDAARNDRHVFISAILHFFSAHPEINPTGCIRDFEGRNILLLQTLLSRILPEQIEELAETYWRIKKEYTEEMIDIFTHTDKPEYKVKEGDKEIRMLDYFKERIARGEMLME